MPMDREFKTELEEAVRLVVQEELTAAYAAMVDELRPVVEAIRQIDRSCKLLLDGQVMFEKWLASQQPELEEWQDADDDADAE